MNWTRKTVDTETHEASVENGYAVISRYGPGSFCAGRYCWQVRVGAASASAVVDEIEQAFSAVERAIEIMREADVKLCALGSAT